MKSVWGTEICNIRFPARLSGQCATYGTRISIKDDKTASRIDAAIAAILRSLAAYESSDEVSRFSSRYDKWRAGTGYLSQKCWPAAEIADMVNHDELGNLGLDETQEAALVAFMKTHTDE